MSEKEYLSICVICGHKEFINEFSKKGYNLVKCRNCGLVFVNPRANEKEILKQYTSDNTSPSEYYIRTSNTDQLVFEKRLDLIEEYFPKGKLFEVGCSVGTFLTTAEKRCWNVEGIEPNIRSVQYCKSKGLKVRNSFFKEELFDVNKRIFDVIYMGDVIEHFRNPVSAVRLANSLLKVGGG